MANNPVIQKKLELWRGTLADAIWWIDGFNAGRKGTVEPECNIDRNILRDIKEDIELRMEIESKNG